MLLLHIKEWKNQEFHSYVWNRDLNIRKILNVESNMKMFSDLSLGKFWTL